MKEIASTLEGSKLSIGIVRSRFNESIGAALLDSCVHRLGELGVETDRITIVMVPGALKSVSFIEKDTKRFPDTNGWAYAQFLYDSMSDTFAPNGNDAKCGYACHATVSAKDYIFTAYPKR